MMQCSFFNFLFENKKEKGSQIIRDLETFILKTAKNKKSKTITADDFHCGKAMRIKGTKKTCIFGKVLVGLEKKKELINTGLRQASKRKEAHHRSLVVYCLP